MNERVMMGIFIKELAKGEQCQQTQVYAIPSVGLGLTTAREAVTLYGVISAKNQVTWKTTFTVRVPVATRRKVA